MDIERCVGTFNISRKLIENSPAISKVFDGLVILRAEMLLYEDAVEYVARGECFDEVPLGNVPTVYQPRFLRKENEDGSVTEMFDGFEKC